MASLEEILQKKRQDAVSGRYSVGLAEDMGYPAYAQPVQGFQQPVQGYPQQMQGYPQQIPAYQQPLTAYSQQAQLQQPTQESAQQIEEAQVVEPEVIVYIPPPPIERNNAWFANAIRGLSEPEFYLRMINAGLLKAEDIDDLIQDSLDAFLEIFFVLQCTLCRRLKNGGEGCEHCFKRYLEII